MTPRSVLAATITTALGGVVLLACGADDGLSAKAGEDFEVAVGESPTFDGCGSEGDIANYRWVIVEAPASMASDEGKVIAESAPDCAFTLEASMIADEVGSWVVELTVTDADGATATDTVRVDVTS